MFKSITRTIWLISLISLFNDFSSEMLYPVIPLYLAQIGYGSVIIGLLEGVAECLSGLSKIYMGSLSDTFNKRLPFIQLGYALSILSRPFIGLSNLAGFILLSRSIDRVGKGIRSGARDALLGDESNQYNRAEIFGFHRSMDTLGAILGPIGAMLYLHFNPNDFKTVFLITIIPGLVAIVLSLSIKEKQKLIENKEVNPFSIKRHFSYLVEAPNAFKLLLIPLLLFSLINSSDMFLLLRAKELGISGSHTIFLYLLFNVVYALFAFPLGKFADKFGRLFTFKIGLLIYALSYLGFAFANNYWVLICSFCLYGLFYAFTQGVIKAVILEKIQTNEKSKAIGLYEGLNSFGLLIANSFAGFIWYWQGAHVLFGFTAFMSILVFILISITTKKHLNKAM